MSEANTIQSGQNSEQSDDQNSRTTKRRVAPLLAKRRQNLPRDAHIAEDKYTFVNDAGDKIHRVEFKDDETGDETVEVNLSKLLAASPSMTSNMEILRLEAEQAAEASADELEDMNPHIPSNDSVLDTITDVLADEGLAPAWEVVDHA